MVDTFEADNQEKNAQQDIEDSSMEKRLKDIHQLDRLGLPFKGVPT